MLNRVLMVLILCSAACAQLPDAPVTCRRVMMDENGHLTYQDVRCGEMPQIQWNQEESVKLGDPTAKTWLQYKGKKAGFFTVRRWNEPPLRTNKDVFGSKMFWIPEATAWGLASADAKLNGCKGTAPCGSELWVDALVPLAVLTPAHWLFDRYICRACSFVGIGIVVEKHAAGIARGVYP